MPSVNNAEKLRLWFRDCPVLQAQNKFGVDYLSESPTEYAINSVPSTLRYHENILGERLLDDIQEQNFVFASKESYSADIRQNLENLGFYQDVFAWIVEMNNAGNFPEWADGKVTSIIPTITAAPVRVGAAAAMYQIQIKITYRREA